MQLTDDDKRALAGHLDRLFHHTPTYHFGNVCNECVAADIATAHYGELPDAAHAAQIIAFVARWRFWRDDTAPAHSAACEGNLSHGQ